MQLKVTCEGLREGRRRLVGQSLASERGLQGMAASLLLRSCVVIVLVLALKLALILALGLVRALVVVLVLGLNAGTELRRVALSENLQRRAARAVLAPASVAACGCRSRRSAPAGGQLQI
eukprot:5501614-Alexandrium_andersonii.AAC.1